MRIRLTPSHQLLSAFSYSSLTDIVLLLLIFFLLTSSFIATKGLTVTLPSAENVKSTDQQQVRVTLHRDGRMEINDAATTPATLRADLHRAVTDSSRQVIVLSSDKDVPFERAVLVMDEARAIGATRFFISTTLKGDGHDAGTR
ncbi:MAG: biopolymer transporter ExbD [Ignavibacteria bacterium]|nr:biopolymer transporter ExbD [Ignavibacteria bacterium]